MQHYNFADEIVKDRDNSKVQRRYTSLNVSEGENIFNDVSENE